MKCTKSMANGFRWFPCGRQRWLNAKAALAALCLLILVACGGGGNPVGPTPDAVPYFVFRGVPAPDTETRAPGIWEDVARCAAESEGKALDPKIARAFPIDMLQGREYGAQILSCGGVNAWGCFHYSRIEMLKIDHAQCVGCPTTASIFQHEVLHLALNRLKASGNLDHTNPAFNKCDPGVTGVGVESVPDGRMTW